MANTIITNSFEETQKAAEKFIRENKDRRIFGLRGELGSGKTTFVQGLARGLGIARKIISPSFIIIRSYEIKNLKRKMQNNNVNLKMFYHVDLYRIKNTDDIKDLGLIELMEDEQNIVAIEWPERAISLLPESKVELEFEYVDEDRRRIKIG